MKTSGSKRLIPVYQHLITEGFIEFFNQCASKDLFEDATPDYYGKRGGNGSRNICRWVRSTLKITDVRIQPNHSFRHRFATLCDNFGVSFDIREKLMGHREGKTSKKYGDSYWISTLKPEIDKMPAPFGLSLDINI